MNGETAGGIAAVEASSGRRFGASFSADRRRLGRDGVDSILIPQRSLNRPFVLP